ncbi:MAG: GNAT family N-acetyltransferase [Proteobacteria bacterium]|nr:GNAT family N-acetyltransferase [Pseudomonadota bacterium]
MAEVSLLLRPLAADDRRDDFDCGRDSLNQWFWRHAWRNQQSGMSRTSVLCDGATGAICGYVALSAGHIERVALPRPAQRNRPEQIPVILLGQLAVDRTHQGNGHARLLLMFALATSVRLSQEIGCFGVVTHPLDDEVRGFYRRFGFDDLPCDPKRSMIVRIVDLQASGF